MTFHSLLSRQIQRLGIEPTVAPTCEQLAGLLSAVNRAYVQADDDRYTLERSLSISGEEMMGLYDSLRSEEALRRREAEGRYRALVASLPGAVYRCHNDPERTIEYVSNGITTLAGHSRRDRSAPSVSSLATLIHPEDREHVENAIAEAVQQAGSYSVEYRIVALDGSIRWVLDRGRLTTSEGISYLDGILLDDSERRVALEETRAAKATAEQATHAKSQFLANMSHELRTPLNAVIGLSGLLIEQEQSAQSRELTTMLRQSASALLDLIEDVLDISKIEAGKIELESSSFRISDVCEHLVSVIGARAATKGLEFGIVTEADVPPIVRGDLGRTRQILLNLASNAVKFTEQGEVRIDIRLIGWSEGTARVRFDVHDTGVGVPPAARTMIFQPFTQADATATRRHEGTGLGLSIAKQLGGLLGGDVGLEPRPGGGSTFWFEAPFETPSGQASPAQKPLAGRRAIVLDRSAHGRSLLADQLFVLGAETYVAVSAAAAVSRVRDLRRLGRPCQLIVVGSSALETLAPDLRDELLAAVPASGFVEIRGFGADAPFGESTRHRCLRKPVTTDTLWQAISGVTSEKLRASVHPCASAFNNARVLVVEDNPANQRVLRLQFKTLGVAVDVASDGEEALQALALRSYALVFMDCQMPRLDGLEATRRIRLREKKTGRRIPIVALTAHALAAERRRCEEAGMDGVLTKPVRREELETCLLRFSAGKATPAAATRALPAIVSELLEIGGTALVEDMLNQWHEQESVRVERLNMLVLSRDSSEALRLAHALKGVAATTGLENLRSILGQVEEYIQGARWRDAERALEQVHGTYVTDIAAIRLALGRTGTLQDDGLR